MTSTPLVEGGTARADLPPSTFNPEFLVITPNPLRSPSSLYFEGECNQPAGTIVRLVSASLFNINPTNPGVLQYLFSGGLTAHNASGRFYGTIAVPRDVEPGTWELKVSCLASSPIDDTLLRGNVFRHVEIDNHAGGL